MTASYADWAKSILWSISTDAAAQYATVVGTGKATVDQVVEASRQRTKDRISAPPTRDPDLPGKGKIWNISLSMVGYFLSSAKNSGRNNKRA